MFDEVMGEARRQAQICNACRYCEGYCAVFPAMFDLRVFADSDLTQLANLCHNCRGCYYACQYAAPHEFNVNLPAILAETRAASWRRLAWPGGLAAIFERAGVVMVVLLAGALGLLFWLAAAMRPESGAGFYAVMSHGLMVAVFTPAFLLPLFAVCVSLRRYWRFVGGGAVRVRDVAGACRDASSLRNLAGGHGEGCNFEDGDRFTNARRSMHRLTLWGFLMCFGSTSSGTVMHYAFELEAPYAWYEIPKLLGVPGGVILCVGTAGLAWLKLRADPALDARRLWSGEMAFVLLLFAVSATGLALYAASGTGAVAWLLPVHLGTVLCFFLVTPYSKMVHGFYRMAALVRERGRRELG